MYDLLLAFALTLPGLHHTVKARAPEAVEAAIAVTNVRGCLAFRSTSLEARCVSTAKILITFSKIEGQWHPSPPSMKGADNDKGMACGVMQVHRPNLVFGSCEHARESLFNGMSEGHAYLAKLTETCGSLERAIGAYATGTCGAAPMLTRYRCWLVGGC